MMLKTEVRPAPLPTRTAGVRVSPPEGATGWATVWLDANSVPQHSPYPVPVDADNRRTEHVRHVCAKGKIEVEVPGQAGMPPTKQVLPCDRVVWLAPGATTGFCPGHGCEMIPDKDAVKRGGAPWGKLLAVADERLRIAAVTAAVGVAGAVDDRADLPWWGDAAEWGSVPAVVWSSWWLTRWVLTRRDIKLGNIDPADEVAGKRRRRLIARRARIAAYAAGAAFGWERIADITDWTSSTGTAVVGMAALAGLGVMCSRPYRAYVDGSRKTAPAPELPDTQDAAPPVTPTVPPGVAAAQRWTFDDPNGAVPNTILLAETYRQVVGGWGIIIRATKPGAVAIDMLTDASAKGRLRVIAGTFGVHRQFFNFVEQDDPNDVLMLVQPNPPLAEAKVWAGPDSIDVDKGVALTGYYIDGTPMYEPFYRPGWGAPSKIVTGTTGSGKALALDTAIPTPDGWSRMGDLHVGGEVFDEDGQPCRIVAATDVMHGRPCYEVEFSDGTVIVADAQHLWKTTTQRGRWQRDNLDRGKTPAPHRRVMLDAEPITTEHIWRTLRVARGGSQPPAINHAVANCGPLHYPKVALPIAPYTLGAWLGDGSSHGAKITSADSEVVDRIREDGYEVVKYTSPYEYGISTNLDYKIRIAEALALSEQGMALNRACRRVGLPAGAAYQAARGRFKPWRATGIDLPDVPQREPYLTFPGLLANVGVLRNKHIPDGYLRASVDDRLALLAGLMDTDGTCGKGGQSVFACTNARLAAGVLDLVLGLGFKAVMTSKEVNGRTADSSTCYSIRFTPNMPVFRMARKRARQRPVAATSTSRQRYIVDVRPVASVPVRCIEVDSPSHLFLASRACIPTHNSENLRKQLIIERYFAHTDPETGEKKGLYASFLHDFKQFESFGEFRGAVHAAGSTVEDAYIMRDALIREMNRRYAMLSSYQWTDRKGRPREGGIKWDPRVHGPILSWTIDEFHEVAKDPAFISPLELLARKMRACGIRIVIGTHMGTLGDTGSRGLRDMLAGGYALLGRTTDSLTSVVTGGTLTADPRQLPKLPGMCLVADGEQQTMHARQTYIPADEDAPVNVYDLLFDDSNKPIGYPAVLPPETLEAFGPEWVAWAEAGKQPGGRPDGKWAVGATADAAEVAQAGDADVSGAKDAVASILSTNGGPMDIEAIDAALQPMRQRGVKCSVSMARKVLRILVEKDKFAFKPKHGFYQVNEHVQEDLLSQIAEAAEDVEQ